jgi:hypothetical protein
VRMALFREQVKAAAEALVGRSREDASARPPGAPGWCREQRGQGAMGFD